MGPNATRHRGGLDRLHRPQFARPDGQVLVQQEEPVDRDKLVVAF